MANLKKEFRVETSAHHCHLTQETLDGLFGKGFDLDKYVRFPLSQHGQYCSTVRVDIEVDGKDGKKHRLNGLSILGPARKYNQFEISLTDARALHIDAPVRQSGHTENSIGCTVISTDKKTGKEIARVELKDGVVAQKRHIHINPTQAEELGVKDGEIVAVDIKSPIDRHVIFDDVVIRVNPTFDLSMHLDTDESNAAGLNGKETTGHLVEIKR